MESKGDNGVLPPSSLGARFNAWLCGVAGYALLAASIACALSLVTWHISDPSLTHATSGPVRNLLGPIGAIFSDLLMQLLGLAGVFVVLPPVFWALELIGNGKLAGARAKLAAAPMAIVLLACAASSLAKIEGWPLPYGLGGALGDFALRAVTSVLAMVRPERASAAAGLFCLAGGIMLLMTSLGLSQRDLKVIFRAPRGVGFNLIRRAWRRLGEMSDQKATSGRREPVLDAPPRPSHFPMPAYAPAYAAAHAAPYSPPPRDHASAPERRHHPDPGFGAFDVVEDDIDPNELKRIAGICAPKTSARASSHEEDDRAVLRAAQARSAPAPSDPISDAMQVMAKPSEPAWPSGDAAHPPGRFADHREHHAPAACSPDPRAPQSAAPTPDDGWRPQSMPGGDDLYGRAVAIVLDDRRASARYLEQRLKIGYMRATDLLERMEREGILGAPVCNGLRRILIGGPGSGEV
jgi:hypothetical protein